MVHGIKGRLTSQGQTRNNQNTLDPSNQVFNTGQPHTVTTYLSRATTKGPNVKDKGVQPKKAFVANLCEILFYLKKMWYFIKKIIIFDQEQIPEENLIYTQK